MKIELTLPKPTVVGTRYTSEFYDDPKDFPRAVVDETSDIVEMRPTQVVLLDYDFKAARRAKGVFGLTWKSLTAVTVIPVAGVALAVFNIGRVALAGALEIVVQLGDEIVDIHHDTVSWLADELAEIRAA